MGELTTLNGKQVVSSVYLAEITQKEHRHLLASIRQMEDAWVKLGQPKFCLSSYITSQNKEVPMYELTKTESLYIATKFNDEARGKVILRWEELEKSNQLVPSYQIEDRIQRATVWIEEEKVRNNQALLITEQTPKVIAWEQVVNNSATYGVDTLSDVVDIGLIKLFEILRSWKWVTEKNTSGTSSTRYCEEQRYGKTLIEKINIKGREINTKRFVLTRKGFDKAIEKINSQK